MFLGAFWTIFGARSPLKGAFTKNLRVSQPKWYEGGTFGSAGGKTSGKVSVVPITPPPPPPKKKIRWLAQGGEAEIHAIEETLQTKHGKPVEDNP